MSKLWKFCFPGYVWSLPNSLIGLVLLATWYWPRSIAWRDGCLEVVTRRTLIGGPWVGAQTYGWVIFYRDSNMQSRGDLAVHERVHVAQAMVGGVFFLLAYGLHFLWLWAIGGVQWKEAYYRVWAEVQAYRIDDEYGQGKRPGAWGDR